MALYTLIENYAIEYKEKNDAYPHFTQTGERQQ